MSDAGDERTGDCRIGDVALDELVPRVIHHALQVLQPSGVGELVERRDPPVRVSGQRMPDEVGPDESGAAGDQHVLIAAIHRCHDSLRLELPVSARRTRRESSKTCRCRRA